MSKLSSIYYFKMSHNVDTWRKSTNRVDKAGEEGQAVSVGWRSEQGDPSEMENYQDKKDEKDNNDFQTDNLG